MNDSKMRPDIQALFSKISGRDVYVIGGGPSFREEYIEFLENKLIICINTAFKYFKNPTAIYWCDDSWACNNLDALESHPCKMRFTSRFNGDGFITKNIKTTAGATVLRRTGDFGIDPNIDNVRGNNSGAHMINFLTNMKVKRIILLGFDMKIKNGKSHWHSGYGYPLSNNVYTDLFIPSIESMAPAVKLLGVDVINCSIDSDLTCFRKEKFEDLIK
jgi:hypothetical protein